MIASPSDTMAERCLGQLLYELNPVRLHVLIDLPLEKATASFAVPDFPRNIDETPNGFLRVAGAFTKHLNAEGSLPLRLIQQVQAEAEAISLLESSYEGLGGNGYDAALVDWSQAPEQTLGRVLDSLVHAVRRLRREEHIQYTIQSLPDPLDWRFRVRLTGAFLDHAKNYLPDDLARGPAARFASCLPQLLLNYIDAQSELQHLLFAD